MFGIDFEALVLLAILAFILFGPEKLPEYAAKFGYYMAKLRQASTELTQQAQSSFNNPLQPPAQPTQAPPPAAQAAVAGASAAAPPAQPAVGEPEPYQPTQQAIAEHNCLTCGRLVNPDFAFCPGCGQPVRKFTQRRRRPGVSIPAAPADEDVTS